MPEDSLSELNKRIAYHLDKTTVQFGPHLGEPWSRVSRDYLMFVLEQYHPESVEYFAASKELHRREKVVRPNNYRLSIHAINRFSQYYDWEEYKKDKEGIVDVIVKLTEDMLDDLPQGISEVSERGMTFVFNKTGKFITLITVK